MPHGYQTARRRAVDAAQNAHREPTENQIDAVERFFDNGTADVYGFSYGASVGDSVDEREAIKALLLVALNA